MRQIFTYCFVAITILACFSCSSEKVDENQQLKDEVIAIHDEVMPYMGELKTLRKKIIAKSDNLVEVDSVTNSQKIKDLKLLAKDLDDAFEGMFVWMRQFKNSYEEMTKEEVKFYLQEQKVMVTKVKNDINASMSASKKELEKA